MVGFGQFNDRPITSITPYHPPHVFVIKPRDGAPTTIHPIHPIRPIHAIHPHGCVRGHKHTHPPTRTYLHVLLPRAARQLALRLELGKLRLVVGVLDGPGAETVADGEGDVVLGADVEDVVPVLVGEVLLVVRQAVLRVDRPPAGDDA